jgi:hypothetical protein
MGLDTTHDCWHGAYSAFSRWRDMLAEAAGYNLHKVDFEDTTFPATMRLAMLDWGLIGPKYLNGDWDQIPVRIDGTPDPLLILLTHYDCEGFIKTEHTGPLADRLEELLPALEGKDGGGHIGLYAEKTQQFIKGLRLASKRGEKVTFH